MEHRRALLIGIDHYYLDDSIGNLQYCVNDVVELDEILRDEQRGNCLSQVLHSQIGDVKKLPTRSNIMSWTSLLANNSESNDSIIFYFAGHGFERNGANYLLPADSRLNVLADTAIRLAWIKDTLNKSPARKKLVIIDACHSGSTIGRSNSVPMSESFLEEMFSKAEGFAALSSCKIGQLAYDYPEKNHGVFSYYLMEGLRGSADRDRDGIITVPDANNYVARKLHEWSLANQVQQDPTFDYNVSGDFIFVRTPAQQKTDLIPSFVVVPNEAKSEDRIVEIIEELSFMSSSENITEDKLFYELRSLLFSEDQEKRVKTFLANTAETKFSSSTSKDSLMPIVANVTELKEIKRWLRREPQIRRYFIMEFVTSNNYEHAGTMAHIIKNMLPTLTNEELLEIIDAIEKNDQINSSFKARDHLWEIVDAAKSIIPLERHKRIREML